MSFNSNFKDLQPYPFERLRQLTADIGANSALSHIPLSLGEPKHPPPQFVIDALTDADALRGYLATYPATVGSEPLRDAIAAWLQMRFGVSVAAAGQILPVNGTREALFSFAQAMLSGRNGSRVLMPNPFYQIYEGAALLAGALPHYVNNDPQQGYQQNFEAIDAATWQAAELVYLCSPGNPTGQLMPNEQMARLIELAHQYDFIVAADECYSELYFDEAKVPNSLLAVSSAMGNKDYARCVVFHSLSKRSNLPGLRSGFAAGDANLMATYLKYRTYHGCALGAHTQHASMLAWQDEDHVIANRALYREKFAAVDRILRPVFDLHQPDGGFYHWLATPISDTEFCRQLLTAQNVTVMPGTYLSRRADGIVPGEGHVRIAWVAELADCIEAAERMARFAQQL